eukprot:SAG31_NODE_2759_length_5134_cov_5.037736_6_plen_191_part_00
MLQQERELGAGRKASRANVKKSTQARFEVSAVETGLYVDAAASPRAGSLIGNVQRAADAAQIGGSKLVDFCGPVTCSSTARGAGGSAAAETDFSGNTSTLGGVATVVQAAGRMRHGVDWLRWAADATESDGDGDFAGNCAIATSRANLHPENEYAEHDVFDEYLSVVDSHSTQNQETSCIMEALRAVRSA